MKTMKDYHNLYLKCDVLLLADVFEKFRNNSLKNYGLCPSHYLSAPALSWDAMLNMKEKNMIKVEVIPDPDMYLFLKKGTRGSNRYSKANKTYLKSYDPKKELKHIIYLDANNLYVCAMSKFLSTCGFKWLDPKEFDLNKYTCNSSQGHVLKVDLEYPKELPELHNDYPLAPDKIELKREILPDYQLKIDDLYNIPVSNVKKISA